MLSKPIKRSPSGAASYYYQTENKTNSVWGGKGAEKLNLIEQVKIEQFKRLLNGFNPYTDEKLRQNASKENSTAGWDFTFSMAKNASILAFSDRRIEKAFKESVNKALQITEERYAYTREGHAGKEKVYTGNLVYAKFTHYNSRANDPQIHQHVFIINTTQGPDGKWRSLDNRELYSNYKLIGQIQEAIFVQKLKELGYKVSIDRKTGIADIKTERENVKEHFSKRSEQIKEKLKELKDKYEYGRDAKQKASWDTRQEKDHNFSYSEMKQKVKKELKENFGINLSKLKQQAQTQEQANFLTKDELKAIVKDSINDITKQQSAFSKEQLESAVLLRSLGQARYEDINAIINQELKENKEIIKLGKYQGNRHQAVREFYTTQEILNLEKQTVEKIKENEKTASLFEKNKALEFIKVKEQQQGFKYTDGQREFIEKALTNGNRYLVVQGNAGSGKTASIEAINEAYASNNYKVIGLAPTGKAVNNLRGVGIEEAYTVSKFKQEVEKGNIQVDKNTALIVDESSMLSSRDMNFVVNQDSSKTILVGDVKQFKPIEQGKSFEDIQKHISKDNFVDMQETVRFKSEIQKETAELMNKHEYTKAFDTLDKSDKIYEVKNQTEKLNEIKDKYVQSVSEGKDTLIITNTNTEKEYLNQEIRRELQEKELISQENHTFTTYTPKNIDPIKANFAENYEKDDRIILNEKNAKGEAYVTSIDKDKNTVQLNYKDKMIERKAEDLKDSAIYKQEQKDFAIGEKITFTKNDRQLGVANGETATITNIEKDKITAVKDNNKEEITFNSKQYDYMNHAYALTNYKSQGQTVDIAIYSHNSNNITNQESFYVATTRAREETVIYTDNKEELKGQIQQEQEKFSTVDFEKVQEVSQNQNRDQSQEINQANKEEKIDKNEEIKITISR